MATLYEYYTTGDDNTYVIDSANDRVAQTFHNGVAAYTIGSAKFKLYRVLTPGTITVTLRTTSGGEPTSTVLATGTTSGDTLTIDTAGEWREIIFTVPYALTVNVLYALVINVAGADGTNKIYVRQDISAGAFAAGEKWWSDDGEANWDRNQGGNADDCMFKTYGPGVIGTDAPVDKTYSRSLVAIGDNEVWYESAADTMSVLAASKDDIDTTKPLTAVEAFQKVFIANKTNLKVADFINTKLTVAALTTVPSRGDVLTQVTSTAKMVVDFVNGAKTEIYGYTTSGTFDTASNVDGGDMDPARTPSAVAQASTTPHWYDWSEYGVTVATSTNMPTSAYLVTLYRGRLVLAGNPNYPHMWWMSKVADPFNYTFSTKPLDAVNGTNTAAGKIGDIVRCLIPYGDDFLIFGCANSVHILDGDAQSGGSIDEITNKTGIFSFTSWTRDEDGNLYFFGNHGIYIMSGGRSKPVNITKNVIPNFASDWAVNPATHRVVLAYDAANRGIVIVKTTLTTGACSGYFYSLDTQGFYPISFGNTADGIFCAFDYNADDPTYRKLLFGCADGYVRKLLGTNKNDDYGASSTQLISSYFTTIEPLSQDSDRKGKLTSLTIELAGGKATTKLTHTALATAHAKGDTLTQATTWATGIDYEVGNVVGHNGVYYICIVEHTSDVDGGDGTGGTPDGNPTDWTVTTVATMIVAYSNAAKTLTFGYSGTGTFTILGGTVTGDGSGTAFTPTAVGTGAFTDVDGCSYEYHKGDDAESCLERVKDGAAPSGSGTLTGPGRKNRIRTRLRAAWLAIKFYNSTASQTFGINKIFGDVKEVGKIKG